MVRMPPAETAAPVHHGTPGSRRRVPSPRRQRTIDELADVFPAINRRISERVVADVPIASSITLHQANVLCMLSREGAMNMHDLARHMNIAVSTATALADRLIKQGQVKRSADPADRRIVRLELTGDAVATVKHHQDGRRRALLAALDALDDDDLDMLLVLLRKVAADGTQSYGRG